MHTICPFSRHRQRISGVRVCVSYMGGGEGVGVCVWGGFSVHNVISRYGAGLTSLLVLLTLPHMMVFHVCETVNGLFLLFLEARV